MIQIKPEDLNIVKQILNLGVPNKEVVAFGSRVNGKPRLKSDLDLAIKNITAKQKQQLQEYFSVAPLSIIIDVSIYDELDNWLKKSIDENGEVVLIAKSRPHSHH